MRKLFLILLPFLLQLTASSQFYNNWYFGLNAGLGFKAGQPTLPYGLTDNQLISFEGSASISDVNGNLLLYTNSKVIYNRFHRQVPNSAGLMGHESTFQSSVIVPQPNSDSLFYVFTADAYENNYENGYRYSIVDIEANGGEGNVISKNVLLSAPGSERLTAARHANGVDVWVIGNDPSSTAFRAWLINCNGLQPIPVVSSLGLSMTTYPSMNIGSLKVSPDGKKLCQTHFRDFAEIYLTNFIQLFDFDNLTGVLSNPRAISIPGSAYNSCEFSPDSRLLYATKPFQQEVDQFNIQLPTQAAIIASAYSIPAPFGFYGIQLGPDGRIYVNRQTASVSVINNPNVMGLNCDLQIDKIFLQGRTSGINFPGVINDLAFDPYNNFDYQVIDSCEGRLQFSGRTNLPGTVQWHWDFGDGTTSTLQNPVHQYTGSNLLYYVKLTIRSSASCGFVQRARAVPSSGLYTRAAFDFTAICDSGYVRFINKSYSYPARNLQFLWDFGDGAFSTDKEPMHAYAVGGNYTVKLRINTSLSCLNDSTSVDIFLDQLTINAQPDAITITEGETVQLDVSGGGSSFFWSPSTWLNDAFIKNPLARPLRDTAYVVVAKTREGCLDSDTVFIEVKNITEVYVPNAFTPNSDGRNDDFKPRLGLLFNLEEFSVFNRWGQKLFVTNISGKGWNGTVGGRLQNPGVYVYYLRFRDLNGKPVERKGSFVLIR